MAIEFTVKSRFIVNGKEYGSVEEMPEEIRAAYAKALKSAAGHDHARTVKTEKCKLVFNANEDSIEDPMQQAERELYKVVRKALEEKGISLPVGAEKNTGAQGPDVRVPVGSGKPIVPESSLSSRKWFSFAAILVFLLGIAYLWSVSGR
jgi:hypothetical protein